MNKLPESTALVCFGSNTADAQGRISNAVTFLRNKGFTPIRDSGPYPSAPEWSDDAPAYLNRLMELGFGFDPVQAVALAKEYETSVRQSAGAVHPQVAVDIDFVVINQQVVRPRDAASAYFHKGLELLKEI